MMLLIEAIVIVVVLLVMVDSVFWLLQARDDRRYRFIGDGQWIRSKLKWCLGRLALAMILLAFLSIMASPHQT
jgi:hypothetical protein